MIITRRSASMYNADPIASSVRSFLSTAVCSDRPAQATPTVTGALDLLHFYPGLYAAPAPSRSMALASIATRGLSAGAAAVIGFAAIFNR